MQHYFDPNMQSTCGPSSSHIFIHTWCQELIKKGLLPSKQRIAIMEAFFQSPEIEDIEHLWLQLRKQNAISWATFYSFIRIALKEKWLLKTGNKITDSKFQLLYNGQ